MRKFFTGLTICGAIFVSSCGIIKESMPEPSEADLWKFGNDIAFLDKNADCVVIGEGDSFIAISPKLQGRVMTSTLEGKDGYSLGWVNRKLIASGESESHRNLFGGEDRFWVGPEGTDFSVFFPANSLFVGENWKIPAGLTSEPWKLTAHSDKQIRVEKELSFANMKNQRFKAEVLREISYISKENATKILNLEVPDSVKCVAYQSLNKITNKGDKPWSLENGIISVSAMSCFHANKSTYGFVPYNEGDKLGNIITDTYNEPIGTDRLSIFPSFVRMRLDGTKIAEINMSPRRSKGILGTYDAERNILTIVTYIQPSTPRKYLPANWRRTNDIFDGDSVRLFNSGSRKEGDFDSPRFYETATYSPALALEPEKSHIHVQRVFHFKGSEYELGAIAYKLLGVSMKTLRPE